MGISNFLNKLDTTERWLFFLFVLTLVGDIASTIYFIRQGLASLEGNILIVTLGWYVGGAIAFLFNILFIGAFLFMLHRTRRNPHERFIIVSSSTIFNIIRFFVIISNIFSGYLFGVLTPQRVHSLEPVGVSESLQLAGIMGAMYIVPFLMSLLIYFLFSRTYRIEYAGDKK